MASARRICRQARPRSSFQPTGTPPAGRGRQSSFRKRCAARSAMPCSTTSSSWDSPSGALAKLARGRGEDGRRPRCCRCPRKAVKRESEHGHGADTGFPMLIAYKPRCTGAAAGSRALHPNGLIPADLAIGKCGAPSEAFRTPAAVHPLAPVPGRRPKTLDMGYRRLWRNDGRQRANRRSRLSGLGCPALKTDIRHTADTAPSLFCGFRRAVDRCTQIA